MRPHGGKQCLKVGVAIKDQPVYKGGEAFVLDIAQPADALALRYGVVVQIFQVRYVLDKRPGALAGNRNPATSQLCDLVGVGQYRLADDKPAPHRPLPKGQLQLFFAGVNVNQALHRHDRVGTCQLVRKPIAAVYAQVSGVPVSRVKLQGLPGKVRDIIHVYRPRLGF